MLLEMVFSTYDMVIFSQRPTLTLTMQAILVVENLFLKIAHWLVGTLQCNKVKSNMLYISLSSVEAKCHAMMHASSKMLWVLPFL